MSLNLIAERICALSFMAPVTYAAFAQLTTIGEDATVPAANGKISNLVSGRETVIRTIREGLLLVAAAGDKATVYPFTGRLEVHEKTTWMVRSLLA